MCYKFGLKTKKIKFFQKIEKFFKKLKKIRHTTRESPSDVPKILM